MLSKLMAVLSTVCLSLISVNNLTVEVLIIILTMFVLLV